MGCPAPPKEAESSAAGHYVPSGYEITWLLSPSLCLLRPAAQLACCHVVRLMLMLPAGVRWLCSQLFRYDELERLVCGLPHLDFEALKAAARYEAGYHATHPTIQVQRPA